MTNFKPNDNLEYIRALTGPTLVKDGEEQPRLPTLILGDGLKLTTNLALRTHRLDVEGGADEWSEHPATQDVDLDGFKITGLGEPTDASDAATKGYVDARPGAEEWSDHPATQDVDLDGHKITGLGAPSAASDAATKGYVDSITGLADAVTEWWDPVWTLVSNVDSVSNIECSYTRTYRAAGGSLVTLEGSVDVTPTAAGRCMASVDLPVARVGSVSLVGPAVVYEPLASNHTIATAWLGDSLILRLIAGDPVLGFYTVGFRISYRAA